MHAQVLLKQERLYYTGNISDVKRTEDGHLIPEPFELTARAFTKTITLVVFCLFIFIYFHLFLFIFIYFYLFMFIFVNYDHLVIPSSSMARCLL